MTATTVQVPAAERAALARAVLARAEERTGTTRTWDGGRAGLAAAPPVGAPPAVVPSAVPSSSVPSSAVPSAVPPAPTVLGGHGSAPGRHGSTAHRPRELPVHPALGHLLPHGLGRGTTLGVLGSTSLLLALVAQASATGSWVAVAGMPHVGVLAADELGMDLTRLVLVPDLGADGPRVLAALLDGMDVVVVGEVALADADRRRLSARAKERSAVLVATTPWPGAGVVLTAEESRWDGVGRGDGRLRTRQLTVSRHGRGAAARSWQGQVVLPPTAATMSTGADVADRRAGAAVDVAAGHGLLIELDGRRAG